MNYFCLDCEASGPVAPLYNLLSIGVTVVHSRGDHHVLGESFYIELKPVFPGFDREALEVCGLDPERLKNDGIEPREAMERLTIWVGEHNTGTRERPVFVGHNAVFDWAYVNYYYRHFGLENPFGYKGIDTKALAMGRLQISWHQTHKDYLKKALDLPAQDPAQVHRADYDAWYQALILQRLLDLRD